VQCRLICSHSSGGRGKVVFVFVCARLCAFVRVLCVRMFSCRAVPCRLCARTRVRAGRREAGVQGRAVRFGRRADQAEHSGAEAVGPTQGGRNRSGSRAAQCAKHSSRPPRPSATPPRPSAIAQRSILSRSAPAGRGDGRDLYQLHLSGTPPPPPSLPFSPALPPAFPSLSISRACRTRRCPRRPPKHQSRRSTRWPR
jgi:hypothetical protein